MDIFPFGDVPSDSSNPEDLARLVPHQETTTRDPAHFAIGTYNAKFLLEPAGLRELLQPREYMRAVITDG